MGFIKAEGSNVCATKCNCKNSNRFPEHFPLFVWVGHLVPHPMPLVETALLGQMLEQTEQCFKSTTKLHCLLSGWINITLLTNNCLCTLNCDWRKYSNVQQITHFLFNIVNCFNIHNTLSFHMAHEWDMVTGGEAVEANEINIQQSLRCPWGRWQCGGNIELGNHKFWLNTRSQQAIISSDFSQCVLEHFLSNLYHVVNLQVSLSPSFTFWVCSLNDSWYLSPGLMNTSGQCMIFWSSLLSFIRLNKQRQG